VSNSDVAVVLEGEASYDVLSSEEQATVRAAWADRMNVTAAKLDLEREFAGEGSLLCRDRRRQPAA
jgi:hypothetical protein